MPPDEIPLGPAARLGGRYRHDGARRNRFFDGHGAAPFLHRTRCGQCGSVSETRNVATDRLPASAIVPAAPDAASQASSPTETESPAATRTDQNPLAAELAEETRAAEAAQRTKTTPVDEPAQSSSGASPDASLGHDTQDADRLTRKPSCPHQSRPIRGSAPALRPPPSGGVPEAPIPWISAGEPAKSASNKAGPLRWFVHAGDTVYRACRVTYGSCDGDFAGSVRV